MSERNLRLKIYEGLKKNVFIIESDKTESSLIYPFITSRYLSYIIDHHYTILALFQCILLHYNVAVN